MGRFVPTLGIAAYSYTLINMTFRVRCNQQKHSVGMFDWSTFYIQFNVLKENHGIKIALLLKD